MTNVLPDSKLPNAFLPVLEHSAVPTFTPDSIYDLYDANISGVGVALAIFDEDGRLLMAEHKATPNNPERSWGPMSETVRYSPQRVEHLMTTAARCIQEEIAVEPMSLGLRYRSEAPVSISFFHRKQQRILAVTIAMQTDDAGAEFLGSYEPQTEEIAKLRFMSRNTIRELPNVRDGVPRWLRDLGKIGVLQPQMAGDLVVFPRIEPDKEALIDTDLSRRVAND